MVPVMPARWVFIALLLFAKGLGANNSVTLLVDLRDQLDFDHVAKQWAHHRPSRRNQGVSVRKALRDVAKRSDRQWIPFLKKLRKRGVVDSWTRVTIVNRFIVS